MICLLHLLNFIRKNARIWFDKISYHSYEKFSSGTDNILSTGYQRRICSLLWAFISRKGNPNVGANNEKIQKVPLVIIGTGPEEETIRQEVHRLGLEERITLAGFKSGEALWRCVRESACVVVPSEWYEASGYTACEAQAMGKPIIVTDAGGLPENIIDGETGFVCPMKDESALAEAIERIINLSDKDYHRMAERAVGNAKKLFCASNYVEKLIRLYANLKRNGN